MMAVAKTNIDIHRGKVLCDALLEDLEKSLPRYLHYHNLSHTKDVIGSCKDYSTRYELNPEEHDLLMIAAAGHDYGFLVSTEDHEAISARIVARKMAAFGYDPSDIEQVKNMIASTKIPQSPKTKLDRIIADADLDYLGRDDYDKISERLYQELSELNKLKDRKSWLNLQISFLEMHSYHTEWAQANRAPIKAKVLERLKSISL